MAGDINKLKVSKEIGRNDILFGHAVKPETSEMFIGSSDFNAYAGDPLAEKFEPRAMSGHESYVTGVALAGEHLVTGSYDGRLIWWNVDSGEQIRAVDAHALWIRDCIASPDGKWIASVADDMVCRLWHADSGKQAKELKGHAEKTPNHFPSMLYAVAFSPDGKHLATGDRVGKVVVWEVESGKQVGELDAAGMYTWDPKARIHSIGGIRSLCFSPDGKQIAVGGMGKVGNIDHLGGKLRLELFDWKSGERQLEYESDKNKGLGEAILYDPKGKYLLLGGGGNDGYLEAIDLDSHKPIKQEKSPMHIHSMSFSDDGSTIYTAGYHKIALWSL